MRANVNLRILQPQMKSPASQLAQELATAKALFVQKRDHFKGLCELYANQIEGWDRADRNTRIVDRNKEVMCVYRYNQRKGESLQAIIISCVLTRLQFHRKRPFTNSY